MEQEGLALRGLACLLCLSASGLWWLLDSACRDLAAPLTLWVVMFDVPVQRQ